MRLILSLLIGVLVGVCGMFLFSGKLQERIYQRNRQQFLAARMVQDVLKELKEKP